MQNKNKNLIRNLQNKVKALKIIYKKIFNKWMHRFKLLKELIKKLKNINFSTKLENIIFKLKMIKFIRLEIN